MTPSDDMATAYAAELTRLREARGLSKRALAGRMAYDRTYLTHIESGRMAPTESFTKVAEDVLDADGTLWQQLKAHRQQRPGGDVTRRRPTYDVILQRLEDMQGQLDQLTGALSTESGRRPRRTR